MSTTSSTFSQPVNPLTHPDWDALLLTHPEHSFFHSRAWARVLTDTYGYTPAYFIDSAAGKLHALLSLMEVDSWLTGRRGIGLPFTDSCEPLHSDSGSFPELIQGALEFGKSRSWKSLECRGGRTLFAGAAASLAFYEHELSLTKEPDRLFDNFDSSVRRAIRKAEKSGVTVAVAQSIEATRTFYSLLCKTRKKHGLPPQPFAFFWNIHEHILQQNHGFIVTASQEGRPIAASVYFHLGGRAIYKYGAADEAFQHLRGSNLVMWAAIQWCVRHGLKALSLGRTSLTNEGLRNFKLNWGTTEKLIEYVRYDLRKHQFVQDADEVSGWYNPIFKSLPIPLARAIGAVLYKHWA